MDTGRIQALILANPTGHVIYERFYSKFGDQERSNIREALYTAGQLAKSPGPGLAAEGCSRFRNGAVAVRSEGDLVSYALGTGDYDELCLSEVLKAVSHVMRTLLRKPASEALLLDNYATTCLALDEMIFEGILESTDRIEALS